MNLLKDLNFNKDPITPKYIQIVDSLKDNITKGKIKINQELPSINAFSKEYGVSRDTVEKAYGILKEKKLIIGRRGKGTYVNNIAFISKIGIFFFANKLSPDKLEIYNSFINHIGEKFCVDLEIYHNDEALFVSLIEKNINKYSYYIVMPHFKSINPSQTNLRKNSIKIIESIPKEKLILLNNNTLSFYSERIEVFQDFENDIYMALKKGLKKIKKYMRLNLVVSKQKDTLYTNSFCRGVEKFCDDQLFDFRILSKIEEEMVYTGDLFIVINDDDLVKFLELSTIANFEIGKDIGIISYNDTPFKRYLNIAVISISFFKMGKTIAGMINNKNINKGEIKNPFGFIDRKSI